MPLKRDLNLQCPSVARRPLEARRSCANAATAWRDSAFRNSSDSIARLGPLRRSLKCLYLHAQERGCEQPCSGSGGAWLDRNRVWRKNTDAWQHETPVLMATACHGLVTRTCSIAPERPPWRWISCTLRRRVNQEKTLFIATSNPFLRPLPDSPSVPSMACPARQPPHYTSAGGSISSTAMQKCKPRWRQQ
jgi:hypothetical protein